METRKGVKAIEAQSAAHWRTWLEKHHESEKSVWLIIYSKDSGKPTVYYPEAVDEALCFGWVDSVPNKRDEQSYFQYFAKRNPKSNWSKVNKQKVARLKKARKMSQAGLEMVAIARKDGTWTALDDVERGIVPEDLKALFDQYPQAQTNWDAFSKSSRRGILEWVLNAKKPETRLKRIREVVELAQQNVKANH